MVDDVGAGLARSADQEPRGFTVVIADDDPDIAYLMGVAVRRAGGSIVSTVHDGAEALNEILRLQPDLALLDVAMPGITGVDVCRQVRADSSGRADPTSERKDTVVILLSAAVHPDAVQHGLDAGAHSYLAKPFSPRALAEHLQKIVADRRSDR